MRFENKRLILLLLFSISSAFIFSQTLYWVGGNGDFQDPTHWSFTSGGVQAGVLPSPNSNVIFDDNSGGTRFTVQMSQPISIKNLTAKNLLRQLEIIGGFNSPLFVGGSIYLSPLTSYNNPSDIVLSSTNAEFNTVEFGLNTLNNNLHFKSGKYKITSLQVSNNNTIHFSGGTYSLKNGFITAGNLISDDVTSNFQIEKFRFRVPGKLKIPPSTTNFTSSDLLISANTSSVVLPVQSASKKYSVSSINAICPIVISTTPSCAGPCTGVLSVSFPTLCNGTTYNILVTGACATTAATLSASGVSSPTTYVATGACSCATNYQVLITDDNSADFMVQNINFIGNPITLTTSSLQPTCSSSTNGRFTGNIFGSSPFSVAVLPATVSPATFSTALTYTVNNVAAGVYTFNVTDASGCTSSITRTMNAPTSINIASSTRSLSCNGVPIGAYSISPTGGTPGYTVAFSSGSTLSTTAGGTVSISSLPAGAYSATVTDTKSCTAVNNVTITQPTTQTITTSKTDLTCPNVCTGIASVSVTGGGTTYNYTWSPGGQNTSSISNVCAGVYTVNILDNFNCAATRVFSVTQPASITLATSVSSITCNSLCNGSATVSASGPTTAVSFTWTSTGGLIVSTSSVVSSRCAGIYTVFAKDAPSSPTCQVSQTIQISQPPAFTITPTTQSITCLTTPCTGVSTVNVSGGNGSPYSYTWNPGTSTSSVATSLCAGNYTVSVRDVSNCPTSATVNVAQPPTFTANITSTSLTCNSVCSGIINSSPTGGTAPYSFTLISSTATVTTAPPFTGLCAGTYTLLIRDSSPATCGQSFTVNLQQPNALALTVNVTSITCFNACNGALAGSANGGTPSYTLTWNTPSSGTVAGGGITNRCPGVYTLNVRDANTCTASITRTLTQPTEMTVSINSTPVNCFGSCNGVLAANISGGTSGYTVTWSNGPTGAMNTGLCAGQYSYIVSDANGCLKNGTAGVATPSAITLSRSVTPARCAGSCNGSATVVATGGTGAFTYTFNSVPAITNTTGIATGLCANNYIVSVRDANACPQSTAFVIAQPVALSAAITGTQNSCTACTGAATVTGSNGTPGYTYSWTNSLSALVSTVSSATALCTGSYTVTVTDSQSCTATTTVGIQQTVISAAVSGGTGIQCFGASTASAVVSPSGGSGVYSFTWTPTSQTTQTATGLAAGNYTVNVREVGGSNCLSTATIAINQPSSLTISSSQTSITCFGNCNGILSTTVSGGTGAKSFSWSPGGQTTSSITNQCAGSYTVRVADANGCTLAPQTFTITQPTSITATFNSTLPTGCTLSNGSICATATGGSGSGYTYTWSPVTGSNSCLTGLSAGAYSVIIRDGTGVCTNTLSTVLNSPAGPTVSTVQQSVTCFGASTGAATLNVTGTPVFSFTWSPAVAGNTNIATSLPSGTYVVSVRDGNSCVTNHSVIITQPTSVTINQNVGAVRCNGGATGSITVNPSGGTTPYTFNWLPAVPPITGQGTRTITSLTSGGYTLNLSDANSCLTQHIFSISAPPALSLTANATNTVICSGFTNGSITANASGGTGAISYTWTPLGPFTGSTTATVLNLPAGVYSVTAIDNNTCSISTNFTLAASTLTSGVVLQSASCSNSCDAVASHTINGGSPTFSFSWSNGATTTSTLGNLCPGNYTATVTDANGCISSKGFTVNALPTFSITLTTSQPKCNATCNGSIVVTPSGAQGAVTYSWAPTASSSSTLTNLCADVYTVSASDGNGCRTSTVVTLIDPPQMLANITHTDPLCNNSCNGIAAANPTNAVGAVSYTWLPSGLNTPSITNLCAINITLNISDANGCTNTQTVDINNPPSLNINSSVGPATCPANNNGSITIIATGGNPGYTYHWTPAVTTNSSVAGLSAQIYTVEVKDASNCSNTVTIPLSNSNGPTAIVSSTNLECYSKCIGAASLSALTGVSPITFSWVSPPAPSTTVNPITNLCAGTYTAVITDGNACITFTSATITEPSSVTVNANIGLPTCNGVCNGSISLTPTGGIPGYSYSWTPAAPITSVLNALCAGDYTVEIGHNSGLCSETHTFNIPGQINLPLATNSNSNTCFGNCNGLASISLTNSTPGIPPPFNFSWSNGQTNSGVTTSTINNLCDGTYSVTVTGSNGCFNTRTVSISSPPQLTITPSVIQPSCNLCNGSVSIQASGGTGSSYTFSWSNGATTSTLTNLCAGIYPVIIRDAANCSQSRTLIVNNSNGITGENVTTKDIPCGASCTGAATVTALGGNLPISYNWINPTASGTVINNLCPGTYFVQMQDAQGCIRTASADIFAATSLTIASFITPPNCGFTDGVINMQVSGGTPGYNYSWTPSAPNTATLTNIGPGSFTLVVTDNSSDGCPTTKLVNISNVTAPQVSLSVADINCFGTCTGSVSTQVTGSSPFNFLWSSGATTSSLTSLCKGLVTLTVTDNNNCKTISSNTINENPQLQINIPQVTQPSCNQCNGLASVNAIGGVGPYTYTWSTGVSGFSINSLCAGIYQVNIKDQLNCSNSQTVIINNSNGISGEIFTNKDIPCGAICNGATTVSAVGGTRPISYNWITPSKSDSVLVNLCPGSYFVQMQDAQGCLRTSSTSIAAAISITINPIITTPTCGMANGTIALAPAGGVPSYNFSWVPSGANTASLNNIGPGSYTVTVTDSSADGCPTKTTITISNPNGPLVTLNPSNINCFGTCSGSVNAVTTGTAPFIYNWSSGGNTPSLNNLCTGVITLTVTDANSCITVKSTTITENPELHLNIPQVTQPSCNQCNGLAQVNAFGGTAPYTYSWTTGASGSSLVDLCAGLYQVLVSDQFSCTTTENIVINSSNGITGENFVKTDVPCVSNCTGGATVSPIGGTLPISYSWINPTLPVISNATGNLCSGIYFVQMMDAKGCKRTASVSIDAATDLTLTASVVQPSCGSGPVFDGIIDLSILGGTSPYTYSWSPVSTTSQSLGGLAPGSYTIVVTDQNGTGCSETEIVTLSNLSGPSITSTITEITCAGLCNGAIAVSPTGTNTTTYIWSSGGITTPSINNVCGIVTLTASANGCSVVKSFTLNDQTPLELNVDTLSISCRDKCDGKITLLPTGGNLVYAFANSSSLPGNIINSVCGGTNNVQSFTLTDFNGCVATKSIVLFNPLPLSPSIILNNASCTSFADGSAAVTLNSPFTNTWTGVSNFTSTSPTINNVYSGIYTLTVLNDAQCSRDSIIEILATTIVKADAGLDTVICPRGSVKLSGVKSLGAVNYSWSSLTNTIILSSDSTFKINDVIGTYTYQLLVSSSVAGCFDTDKVSLSTYSEPFIDAGPSFTMPVLSTVTIGGNPTYAGVENIIWSPAFYLNDATLQNPVASNTVDVTFTVTANYGNGCLVSDTMIVSLYPEIKVNSGFSPNSDGKNDLWVIDYLEQFPSNTVEIYNRWGELLFFSKGYQTPFDGTYKGKNLPVGTYYYVIHLNHPAYPKPYTGPVTIFR